MYECRSVKLHRLSWEKIKNLTISCEYFQCYSFQKEYKRDLENEIKGKGMEVSTDTLDIQRAKKASEIVSQVSTELIALRLL